MENKIHSVKYNFIMNFILTASQFIFPFITFPYIARTLTPVGNGRVEFASSVANYFLLVASLGIPTYGVRACAMIRDDKNKLSQTVQELFLINCVTTILVSITYFISIFVVQRFAQEKTLFLINGINIILNMFGMNWVYQALEQYDYITVRSLFFKFISIVLMFLLVHNQDDYIIYGAIVVLAASGSNLLNFFRLRKIISFSKFDSYEFGYHLKPIFTLFAQTLAISVYTNLDTVMLGFMKSDIDVGYFNAAVKIRNILNSLVTSLGSVLLPRMSYYVKNGMRDLFKTTVIKSLNFSLLMSLPLSAFFVIYATEGLLFVAGEQYIAAVSAMRAIIISIIPVGITGVLGTQVLTSMEKDKILLYSVTAGAIADFILNIILIPNYGAFGAAIATTATELFVLIIQVIFLKDLLKDIAPSFRFLYYFMLTMICSALSFIINIKSFSSSLISLFIHAVLFFGLYGLLLIISRDPIVIQTITEVKLKLLKGQNQSS